MFKVGDKVIPEPVKSKRLAQLGRVSLLKVGVVRQSDRDYTDVEYDDCGLVTWFTKDLVLANQDMPKKDFFLDRKAEAMKGIDPKTGETLASKGRGGGNVFL